jgi:indole-3-acetate monooxygenase
MTPLARAERAAAVIADASAEIETSRKLPAAVLDAMHAERLFRLTLPAWLDGDELGPADLAQITMRVAAADASAGWCLGQSFGCAMSAAFLDESVAREVFGPANAVLAWGAGAQGRATVVDGGFRVTGAWRFASGGKHATWLGGHCKVFEADGSKRRDANGRHADRTVLVRREVAEMADDWHVMGLRGTRSEGYALDDVFVADAYTLNREDPAECRLPSPLFEFPTTNVYASAFSGVALGIARGALDDLTSLAQTKTARGARSSLRESPVFQTELAELEATWRAARAYQQSTIRSVWDDVVAGAPLQLSQRADIRLATTFAITQSVQIVQAVYRLAGSSAIFVDAPFERRFRDMHTVSQQVQGRRTNFETVGRMLLGHEAETLFM